MAITPEEEGKAFVKGLEKQRKHKLARVCDQCGHESWYSQDLAAEVAELTKGLKVFLNPKVQMDFLRRVRQNR